MSKRNYKTRMKEKFLRELEWLKNDVAAIRNSRVRLYNPYTCTFWMSKEDIKHHIDVINSNLNGISESNYDLTEVYRILGKKL